MKLHEITIRKKRAQRVGRGGKRGTTSGKGTKGQKSRSGHKIRPASRDLLIRIPKLRGFRNKPLSVKPLVVNLDKISTAKSLADKKGQVVLNRESLLQLGLIPAGYRGVVKLLSKGEIAMPIIVKGLKTSQSAKDKIEKAGGKVE